MEEVRALKEAAGQGHRADRQHHAGPRLIEAGLVDEYRLFTYPVVQGRGRRLFPDGFRLGGSADRFRSFRSGVTLTTYAV